MRWLGAFVLLDTRLTTQRGARTAERGQLYFTLPPATAEHDVVRREWADLAAVAGTGEAVAFGDYPQVYEKRPASSVPEALIPEALRKWIVSEDGMVNFATYEISIQPPTATDIDPVAYSPAGVGVVRLAEGNYEETVRALRAALLN
jgi:hypothetical protein